MLHILLFIFVWILFFYLLCFKKGKKTKKQAQFIFFNYTFSQGGTREYNTLTNNKFALGFKKYLMQYLVLDRWKSYWDHIYIYIYI